MSAMIAHQILAASGMAYLIADRDLVVRGVGGDIGVIDELGAAPGSALVDLLPELYGSEETLGAIIAGRLERLHFPDINRESAMGAVRYLDLLTLPQINDAGQIIGLIQVITDASERGEATQARVQQRNEYRLLQETVIQQNIDLARTNAELRRATQLKDEFLAGMSHEVRTPLTVILGMTEIIRAQFSGPLTQQQIENLNGIQESGRHLLALINDFLDIAKIEAGQFELDPSPILVTALCESAVRMVGDMANRKRIRIALEIDPEVRLISGDDRRLRQALINLLSNAVKFTPAGGKVGLSLQGNASERVVYFSVWDTGVGIAAEDAQRLFQPFAQIAGAHQDGQQGSGLGLVLVAQLAEMHGGGIRLESEVGKGSRFTMTLPWDLEREQALRLQMESPNAPPAATIMIAEPLAEPLGGGQPVLLVEDDPASAELLGSYLRRCDYQVTIAGSAEEAMACVRAHVPNLVITDVRMRGMDGLELIRRLRAGVATRETPIIALTALAMAGDRERCLAAGASLYMSKPLLLSRLAEAAAELLGRPR
ncbi:response regulator [Oscillochloris sp. ZM17-4]|uniref:hybrid sensor histidine kinase/response regulator n=1 Tax=Oscillochloris sp. ZM17-4 TaxID=2866714 RepID=UPI001C73B58D|nr:ATP-binding protein [Oscillochloris sp. ZM17-4]MBX0329620.1 response regulator [Oscillochloris sp. ZM17-4]